jgi:hypothetical protein
MANTVIMEETKEEMIEETKAVKINIMGYTIISFIDIEVREIMKHELGLLNIGHEYSEKIIDNLLINLTNNPVLMTEFINNKKENIKDTKKNIKEILKNTKKNQLVKTAKTPKQIKVVEEKAITKSDYSNSIYLNKLKLTELRPILNELSKNRNDINKYCKKKEMIELIIQLNNNLQTQTNTSEHNDDENQSDASEHNDDENQSDASEHNDDENQSYASEHNDEPPINKQKNKKDKKIPEVQKPKKITKK